MGLFKKQYCIDCGAACGITSPILGDESNGVQGVQTRLKRKDRFESK